jgi:hypothetical protein
MMKNGLLEAMDQDCILRVVEGHHNHDLDREGEDSHEKGSCYIRVRRGLLLVEMAPIISDSRSDYVQKLENLRTDRREERQGKRYDFQMARTAVLGNEHHRFYEDYSLWVRYYFGGNLCLALNHAVVNLVDEENVLGTCMREIAY